MTTVMNKFTEEVSNNVVLRQGRNVRSRHAPRDELIACNVL